MASIVKVHVVLAGAVVPAWQAACVRELRAVEGLEVTVSAGARPYRAPRGLAARLAGPALAAETVDGPDGPGASAFASVSAPGAAGVVVDLAGGFDPSPQQPGGGAGGADSREVWRFRLGADDDAAAPFVREIGGGAESVEVVLVRRAAGRDEVLRRGRFPVTRWHPSTLRWSLLEAARWPAIVLGALRAGSQLAPPPPTSGPVAGALVEPPPRRRALAWTDRARFAFVLARRAAGYAIEELFEMVEWNVGFADGDAASLLDDAPLRVRWLPRPPRGTFCADPFLIERDGRRALLVEDFDYARERGVISALELDGDDRVVRSARVIDLPGHLSYPYPLAFDGALYAVPESSALNEVALYRCVEFPWRWQRETALFPAFDGIDTTLFEHGGRWWALCTRASRGSNFALYAYYADVPRGPWHAHALNPVVEDVTSARPAGRPFVAGGALYRPGQNCARAYGAALAIARIDELTPLAYRETIVRRIDADGFGRYANGVHTLGVTPRGIVLDGKHTYLDVRKLVLRAQSKRRWG